LDAAVLRTTDERVVPDADLAERHDDEARRDWLAARLREALARSEGSWAAIVLPPLLGIDRARAEELTQRVGAPCGEAMGLPGGPSGLRFERASRRAYAGAGIAHVVARATRVARAEGHFIVQTEEEGAFEAQAVVLAAGGLLGGGLEYAPSDSELATALPAAARLAFRLTIDAPATVGASRRPLEIPGSLFGVPPESLADRAGATSLLDHTGILTRGDGTVLSDMPDEGVPGLFAAGEIVADAPRFWLSALSSGTIAGVSAARFVASGSATPFHHFERGGLDAGGV
jgi:glycerol-3-phosphate dehydrogenase subunit B